MCRSELTSGSGWVAFMGLEFSTFGVNAYLVRKCSGGFFLAISRAIAWLCGRASQGTASSACRRLLSLLLRAHGYDPRHP